MTQKAVFKKGTTVTNYDLHTNQVPSLRFVKYGILFWRLSLSISLSLSLSLRLFLFLCVCVCVCVCLCVCVGRSLSECYVYVYLWCGRCCVSSVCVSGLLCPFS